MGYYPIQRVWPTLKIRSGTVVTTNHYAILEIFDPPLDYFPQRDVHERKRFGDGNQGAIPAPEHSHASCGQTHQDVGITDDGERFFKEVVSHGGMPSLLAAVYSEAAGTGVES